MSYTQSKKQALDKVRINKVPFLPVKMILPSITESHYAHQSLCRLDIYVCMVLEKRKTLQSLKPLLNYI